MSQSQTAIEELAGRALTTLSEDEQMFRASVREFAEGELRPRVEEMEETRVARLRIAKRAEAAPAPVPGRTPAQ